MSFKLNLKLFLKEAILFSLCLTAGIFIAYRLSLVPASSVSSAFQFRWTDILFLVIFIGAFIFIQRNKKISAFVFKLFLIIIVFSGAQLLFQIFVNPLESIALAVIMVAVFISFKNVIFHDLAILVGLAGVGAIIGLSINPQIGLAVLVILSFYDIIAVYKTRHMVTMAQNMIESGAIFGFVIPFGFKDFLSRGSEVRSQIGQRFMVLGSGDVGLPVIFAGSLVRSSLMSSIIVGCFSIAGLFVTHLLFINQKQRAPMAALPPIATFAIIGYLVSLFI